MLRTIGGIVLAAGAFGLWRRAQQKPESLAGKVVIVTGASAGIGKATAAHFAARNATVVLVARRENLLKEVQAGLPQGGGESLVYPADLSQEENLVKLVDDIQARYGRIDVLVNNAGMTMGGYFHESDPAYIQRMFRLNLDNLLRLTHLVLPGMLERGSGHIVNISSVGGILLAPGMVAYATTKAAVNGFSDALRRELYGTGVNVSAILPGWTQTDMIADMNYDLAYESWLINPTMPLQQVDHVARHTVDAVRFNRPFVVLGGLSPVSNSWPLRLQARVLDFMFYRVFNREKFVAAMGEGGLS